MEFLYINLDKDTDRNEDMKELLKDFSYTRIPAVYNQYGPLGSAQSHINALEYAIEKDWDSVCIMEDDLIWNDNKNWSIVEDFLQKPFDVLMLCGVLVTHNPQTHKLNKANCAAAYIVKKHYYQTLLRNFKESLQLLKDDINQPRKKFFWNKKLLPHLNIRKDLLYRIDTYWHSLQEKDSWFIIPIFISKPNFSNTTQTFNDYSNIFLK